MRNIREFINIAPAVEKIKVTLNSVFDPVFRQFRKIPDIKTLLNITTKREKIRETLCSAIESRRVIEFYYHGGYRTVEPFCLGLVRSGEADNESLLCYQTGGFSELREVVGWKLYRASEMEEIELLNERFTGDRPGYDPGAIEMATLYTCVTPVKEAVAVTHKPPRIEPLPRVEPPPEPQAKPHVEVTPVPKKQTLTHNQMMRRFRSGHGMPVQRKYTHVPPEPSPNPLPETPKSKFGRFKRVFDRLPMSRKTG